MDLQWGRSQLAPQVGLWGGTSTQALSLAQALPHGQIQLRGHSGDLGQSQQCLWLQDPQGPWTFCPWK